MGSLIFILSQLQHYKVKVKNLIPPMHRPTHYRHTTNTPSMRWSTHYRCLDKIKCIGRNLNHNTSLQTHHFTSICHKCFELLPSFWAAEKRFQALASDIWAERHFKRFNGLTLFADG